MTCFGLGVDGLGNRTRMASDLSAGLNLDHARDDLPPIPKPAVLEPGLRQRTEAFGHWLVHASEKPVTDLRKAALTEAARRFGREDLMVQVQAAKSVLDADAVALKLEAELWKQRRSATRPE
jgi:hypothetical protein